MSRLQIVTGSLLVSGLLLCVGVASDNPPAQVPSSKQLLEMAATEMAAAGMETDPLFGMYNGIGVLVAVGRFEEAVDVALRSENELQRKAYVMQYVSEIVRFRAEDRLEDAKLKAVLQPQEIAEFSLFGLIERGDLDDAETRLRALSVDHPFLWSLIEQHFRIVEKRISHQQTEATQESLRLTVECISLQSERNPRIYLWLKQLERCSELVARCQVPELIPQVLANVDVACGLLEKSETESTDRARYCSNLAAMFFYCGEQEKGNEQITLAKGLIDRSFEELRKEIDSGSASPVKLSLTATSLLETTGRVAALLANSGRLEEARKLIESTKERVQTVEPDKEMYDDWAIVKMLIDYGAFELADEFVSAARSPYWRCHFQIELCEELAQRKRREDAIGRLQKVIPQFSLEANPVNRFGLQDNAIRLLKTLDEEQIRSKLLKEVLDDCQSNDDPKHLQSVFLLLITIRDYENAWNMVQQRELAGSKAMNLAMLGLSLHDHEVTTSGKK